MHFSVGSENNQLMMMMMLTKLANLMIDNLDLQIQQKRSVVHLCFVLLVKLQLLEMEITKKNILIFQQVITRFEKKCSFRHHFDVFPTIKKISPMKNTSAF